MLDRVSTIPSSAKNVAVQRSSLRNYKDNDCSWDQDEGEEDGNWTIAKSGGGGGYGIRRLEGSDIIIKHNTNSSNKSTLGGGTRSSQ